MEILDDTTHQRRRQVAESEVLEIDARHSATPRRIGSFAQEARAHQQRRSGIFESQPVEAFEQAVTFRRFDAQLFAPSQKAVDEPGHGTSSAERRRNGNVRVVEVRAHLDGIAVGHVLEAVHDHRKLAARAEGERDFMHRVSQRRKKRGLVVSDGERDRDARRNAPSRRMLLVQFARDAATRLNAGEQARGYACRIDLPSAPCRRVEIVEAPRCGVRRVGDVPVVPDDPGNEVVRDRRCSIEVLEKVRLVFREPGKRCATVAGTESGGPGLFRQAVEEPVLATPAVLPSDQGAGVPVVGRTEHHAVHLPGGPDGNDLFPRAFRNLLYTRVDGVEDPSGLLFRAGSRAGDIGVGGAGGRGRRGAGLRVRGNDGDLGCAEIDSEGVWHGVARGGC